MTKYCPKCYVGVEPEDSTCASCGAALTPDKVEMKETFDENPITEELASEASTPVEDPADSADVVLAPMVESNTCKEAEANPFDNSADPETMPKTMGVQSNFEETFEEKTEPQITYHPENKEPTPKVMGLGEWLLTLFLVCIPIVNLVMLIYWSAGNEIDPNKKNFARAQLILMGIGVVISFFFFGSMMAMIMAFGSYYYY